MAKSFRFVPPTVRWRVSLAALKDPRVNVRVALGTLLLLNLVAA
jgi:hypothetical protein